MRKLVVLVVGVGLTVGVLGCGGPPGGCSTPVSADITSATTWTPGCAYLVDGVRTVSAPLTIQPGAVVRFTASSGLIVDTGGSLNAVGTASTHITFTGATATAGFWRGLAFRTNNPANELTYVDVTYAGSDAFCCDYFEGSIDIKSALVVGGATASGSPTLKLTHSTVARSGGYGVYAFNGSRLPGFSSNTFHGNQKAPVGLPLSIIGALDSASAYSGTASSDPNGEQFVRVAGSPTGDTAVNQTVNKLDVPYGMGIGLSTSKQQIEYSGALTVSPGTRFEFEANSGLEILETGSLMANGTPTDKIVFTGHVQTRGYWLGLAFRSTGNTLNNAIVSEGGGSDFCCDYFVGSTAVKANLVVGGATLSGPSSLAVTNSTISDSLNYGVFKIDPGTVNDTGTSYSGNATDKNF